MCSHYPIVIQNNKNELQLFATIQMRFINSNTQRKPNTNQSIIYLSIISLSSMCHRLSFKIPKTDKTELFLLVRNQDIGWHLVRKREPYLRMSTSEFTSMLINFCLLVWMLDMWTFTMWYLLEFYLYALCSILYFILFKIPFKETAALIYI